MISVSWVHAEGRGSSPSFLNDTENILFNQLKSDAATLHLEVLTLLYFCSLFKTVSTFSL